ncbi:hypothetical protein TKK_0013267 [Trichogramma kaykai]|uniref:Protein CNPPD1 n=1 Tax=Trichogramma kaykai TaxID=54128 RepID=A0ABD2WJT3_9HYME
MTRISKASYAKFSQSVDGHDAFLNRISKTLHYTKLPVPDCLSLPVTELAAEIFTEVKNGQTLERLDVEEASQISRNACVSPCSLVVALLYLERLKDCNPEYLQKVAPSELFLVSLMVASKFLHDDGEEDEVFNAEWAQSGNLSCTKINRLEKEFLKAIDWSVYVHSQEFWRRLQNLEKDVAFKEAHKRGWFSYTELNTLLNLADVLTMLQTLVNVCSFCIATYTAGLFTLLGAVTVAAQLPDTLLNMKQSQSLALAPSTNTNHILHHKNLRIQSLEDFEEDVESLLLDSVLERSKMCNESYANLNNFKINDKHNNNNNQGLQWIVDYITLWFQNSANLKPKNYRIDWENSFNQNRIYVTKTDFFIESDSFLQHNKDGVYNKIEKQAHDSSLKMFLSSWKYYSHHFFKIPLSQDQ